MTQPPVLVPGYRSRFGGLWTDRLDAAEILRAKLAKGEIDGVEARLLERWMREGFAVIEGAVPAAVIDAFNADVERMWEARNPRVYTDYVEDGERWSIPVEPRHRHMNIKVIDLYPHVESARSVMLAPAILEFLRLIFEREPMAFQSLYFRLGSMQSMHQDTVYVGVDPPMEFVGCWVALEDIREDSGELEYLVGSHRIDEFLWDGVHKLMPAGHPDHQRYLDSLHERAAQQGLERMRFRPRKGDVLFWSADLAHGGSPVIAPGATRRSLVTHFCPIDREPLYFSFARHSEKLANPTGGFYCYAYRWPAELDEREPPSPELATEPSNSAPPSRLRQLWQRLTSP
jgi:ectoine hydroxylase-related dioxygenase (phytanoyl-CoA dioxygenase family)